MSRSKSPFAIVELPTGAQAEKVAHLTGGSRLVSAEGKPTRRVEIVDFDQHRSSIESVSVLFKLHEPTTDGLVEAPSGWSVTAAKFEVEWPDDPARASLIRSHFGARRMAYNWALAQVRSDMDAKKENADHESVPWTLQDLRKAWNKEKITVAPWWADNSKECYSSGIADLVRGLDNWNASKNGQRKGRKVGFPRFSSRHKDHGRIRFTTGTMRLESDRRHITVPVIGALRSKENTRHVERRVRKGDARILSMTLSKQWNRLFVSVSYAARTVPVNTPEKPTVRAGVDLGLRTLATIATSGDEIIEFPNPAPLRATLNERRRTSRQLFRRIPGSLGHKAARTKLARLDRRAVHLRQEAWHQLTHELVSTYGEVRIEDLDIAAMKKSMGRRAFRRAVADAALGQFRPMLAYRAERTGTVVTVEDRWFPSSQIHHGCRCRLAAEHKMAKELRCAVSGEMVDRDHNASKNLRDWPDMPVQAQYGACAPVVSGSGSGAGDAGSDAVVRRHRASDRKTSLQVTAPSSPALARRGEAKTDELTLSGVGL